jgi:hypothetical protein
MRARERDEECGAPRTYLPRTRPPQSPRPRSPSACVRTSLPPSCAQRASSPGTVGRHHEMRPSTDRTALMMAQPPGTYTGRTSSVVKERGGLRVSGGGRSLRARTHHRRRRGAREGALRCAAVLRGNALAAVVRDGAGPPSCRHRTCAFGSRRLTILWYNLRFELDGLPVE